MERWTKNDIIGESTQEWNTTPTGGSKIELTDHAFVGCLHL